MFRQEVFRRTCPLNGVIEPAEVFEQHVIGRPDAVEGHRARISARAFALADGQAVYGAQVGEVHRISV